VVVRRGRPLNHVVLVQSGYAEAVAHDGTRLYTYGGGTLLPSRKPPLAASVRFPSDVACTHPPCARLPAARRIVQAETPRRWYACSLCRVYWEAWAKGGA
jgi:hypothetical protein